MSESLIFFNKEGDALNFNYNQFEERFEGDILFHENSSDTYKTYGLYVMEKVPSIEFDAPSRLSLNKFQLFNEWGFHFYQKTLDKQIIKYIEPVNNDWNFYSKWIHGDGFDSKFPIGTLVRFNNPIFEFTDDKRLYTVINSKKDAIMIISDVDNSTFELKYSSIYNNPETWTNLYLLNSVNCIGIYDYVNSKFENNLSSWNEPNFYDKFFFGKKLNVVNSKENDGVYTTKSYDIIDLLHFEYSTDAVQLGSNDLIIEVISKRDLPKIFEGNFEIKNKPGSTFSTIHFNNFLEVPNLKPGTEFTINGSNNNTNFYRIEDILKFNKNFNKTFYTIGSLVIYNNQVWECVKDYTQDQVNNSSITPENSDYWNKTSFLPIRGILNNEILQNAQIYLTTNREYFLEKYDTNSIITLSKAAENYKSNLENYGVDLYFENNELKADLKYSSKYNEINFYKSKIDPINLISKTIQKNERLIEVEENLNHELNYDFSKNQEYNIVFTDIDDWGIKIKINGQIYESDLISIYKGSTIDMERSIDKTLRNWLTINYVKLYTLGIVSEIDFTGNISNYQNTIILKTFFPNVPISVKVEVGNRANFYVEHSMIVFKNTLLSTNNKNLIININDIEYPIESTSTSTTLSNWVLKYKLSLLEYGIIVNNINNSIKIDTKYPDRRLDIKVDIGKVQIPGNEDFYIKYKGIGNKGTIITSNEITLSDDEEDTRDFEKIGLSTGMLISINNAGFVYDNTEYNIQYVDKNKAVLSYQGPFWGLTNSIDNSSAWTTIGFSLGFGITASYTPDFIRNSDLSLNHFNKTIFSAKINSNVKGIDINSVSTFEKIYDLFYVQIVNCYYVLSKKGSNLYLYKIESSSNKILNYIDLGPESTVGTGIKIEYNKYDNFIYCLSTKSISIIDPIIDISRRILLDLNKTAKSISINQISGYEYILYTDDTISTLTTSNSEYRYPLTTTATVNSAKPGGVGQFQATTIVISGDFTNIFLPNSELTFTYKQDDGTSSGKTLTWKGKVTSSNYDPNTQTTTIQPNYNSNIALIGNNPPPNTLNNTITTSLVGVPNLIYNTKWNETENATYLLSSNNKIFKIDSTYTKINEFTITNLDTSFIEYEPINDSIIVRDTSKNLYRISNDIITPIKTTKGDRVLPNIITSNLIIDDSSLIKFTGKNDFIENNLSYTTTQPEFRSDWCINQYDSFLYIYDSNKLSIIDSYGKILKQKGFTIRSSNIDTNKLMFNTDRNTILMTKTNTLYEIKVYYDNVIEYKSQENDSIKEDMWGNLDPEYQSKDYFWLKTREFVRRPRENYVGEVPVKYYWNWLTDENPEFFLYDISGDQISTGTSSYTYEGPTPLIDVPLNKNPNKDISKIDIPEYQQTIFDRIEKSLDYINDSENIDSNPEAIEIFIGFKSEEEGPKSSILQMYKREDIEFSITSNSTNGTILEFETLGLVVPSSDTDKRAVIRIASVSDEYFTDRGLKSGQLITIFIKDTTNQKDQYTSPNNGSVFRIRNVYSKEIVLDFLNIGYDMLYTESSKIIETGRTTYTTTTFKVIDKEIGRFTVYGQTEIEDFRFKTHLNNIGKNISPNEVFIFKEYDIYEGGIDWTFLNKKRKELLIMRNEIFPYVGSYKSIINAINYFGYNDLKLNEYYRDIDKKSSNFLKLFKVEIPDIFDNSVEGWTDNDYLKYTLPNDNYEGTNLFNLTYDITNKDGDITLNYSLDEVTIKLNGLKKWLRRNIIPITHKILDVTGNTYLKNEVDIKHKLYDVIIFKNKENMTPITFKLNEAYLMPVNSGSTVYNCVLDIYSILSNKIGIKPNNDFLYNLELPDYYDIKIRTWKTYREWEVFTEYKKGEKVIYYGNIYESAIDSNKMNSPIKWESLVFEWSPTANYEPGNIVRYENEYYSYTGLGSEIENPLNYDIESFNFEYPTPLIDNGDGYNWVVITEWRKINYEPVQTISEFRKSDNLTPFNFTLDANIDPFVTIELTCDNGYGLTYKDRKNYEIRTLKDLRSPTKYIENIGPFEPIAYIK